MTRATRSQATVPKHPDPSSSSTPKKFKDSRKRKRLSSSDPNDDLPPAKLSRRQQDDDIQIDKENAAAILQVLESVDAQGLLDRVFPSAAHLPSSPANDNLPGHSLRSLLQNHEAPKVRSLLSAVEPLRPISTQPRARKSDISQQQHNFCELALRLIDDASQQSSHKFDLQNSSVFPDIDHASHNSTEEPDTPRRYALMQKLPAGEFWTSLNDSSNPEGDSFKRDLPNGANLVSIFPSMPPPTTSRPSLASLITKKHTPKPPHRLLFLHSRRLSKGTFLDYGPASSFAPCWDSEGGEVGRFQLGTLIHSSHKYQARLANTIPNDENVAGPSVMVPTSSASDLTSLDGEEEENTHNLHLVQETLGIENSVSSLLINNAVALRRIQYLQGTRLLDGKTERQLEEDDICQALTESLSTLMAARPRLASPRKDEGLQLLPSLTELRRLHKAFVRNSHAGWNGTLAENHQVALRGDFLVRLRAVQPPVKAPAPQPSGASATPAAAPYRNPYPYYSMPSSAGQPGFYPTAYPGYPPATGGQTVFPYVAPWGYHYAMPGGTSKPATPGGSAYGSYYPPPNVTAQRAVANTAKPSPQTNGWPAAALPSHLLPKRTDSPSALNRSTLSQSSS